MSPTLQLIVESVVLFLCMGLIKHWLIQVERKIEGRVTGPQCDERRNVVCRKIETLSQETQEQWAIINNHGHRGLVGDNNQVVRTE